MNKKYDDETSRIMQHAVEDLQRYMANAGRDTTEAAILSWQQGYIAGVNRAMSTQPTTRTEDYDE
jgi:hypothetical protein